MTRWRKATIAPNTHSDTTTTNQPTTRRWAKGETEWAESYHHMIGTRCALEACLAFKTFYLLSWEKGSIMRLQRSSFSLRSYMHPCASEYHTPIATKELSSSFHPCTSSSHIFLRLFSLNLEPVVMVRHFPLVNALFLVKFRRSWNTSQSEHHHSPNQGFKLVALLAFTNCGWVDTLTLALYAVWGLCAQRWMASTWQRRGLKLQ